MVAIREKQTQQRQDLPLIFNDEPALDASLRRPPRRDALPEHTHYVDTGCSLHSSCLTCPLARCRYEEPGGARRILSDDRDRSILTLRHEQGLPVNAIAQRYGVSRRTVFRILARERSLPDS